MSFTDAQIAAIEKDGNLIVSAAAGAGKTTVLTERVYRLVTEGTKIEHMLVLTFTRAAAGEMKTRIAKRLSDAAKSASGGQAVYLREQAAAVANASISTIDAFCAKVVFRHFFRVGLTPSVKTLDETETAVLRAETRNAVLDALAADHAEAYRTLIVAFGSEPALLEAMEGFENFLSAQPDPMEWIDRNEAAIGDPDALNVQLSRALESDKTELVRAIDALQSETDKLSPAYDKILSILYDLLSRARGALTQKTRGDYAASLNGILGFKDSLRFPNGTPDADKAGVQDAKLIFRKIVKEQAERNGVPVETIREQEEAAAPILRAFYALTRAYFAAFAEAKRAKNAIDFSDLEHMTIEILKDDEIAAEYRDRFQTIIVDEYQDSNRVQETILNRIARPGGLFFVGDVKQSIYRFRMAEPGLFLEKCDTFKGARGTRIDLGHNFRSGKAVVDAVNATFETIMKKPVAGIEYDARAKLIQGDPTVPDGRAELHLFEKANDPDEEETLEDAEAEARFAANVILERMQRPITEKGEERACRFGDFAVLLRNKNYARVWAQTLSEQGISCYAQASGGYFDAIEVKLLMSFLQVLDNRRQDIPLLAVLRSPLFGFTDAELSAVRIGTRKGAFLDCLLRARETEPKVAAFFDTLERYEALSRRIPLGELIERILDETHYREMVGVLAGGEQRLANLSALIRAAEECDAAGMSGVHGFLRFMENVKATEKLGAAATVTADVVRIMTVHASKGLEFPVVFYAGLGGTFNTNDEKKALLPYAEPGTGLKYADEFGVKHETITHENAVRAVSDASWAEELRVLYVGMTRAKQELYLLGSASNAEKCVAEVASPTLLSIRKSNTPLKLLLPALNGHITPVVHTKSEFYSTRTLRSTGGIEPPTAQERKDVEARFSWVYPHPIVDTLPDKTSVTGLSKDDSPEFLEPAFDVGYDVLSEGSAVHRALECMPLDEAKRAAFLQEIPGVSPFHADAIRDFAASPLFRRMAKAKRVEREWSFLCPMPASTLLDSTDSNEPILLQGVIDACFVEDGAWVLLDYKTDRVTGDPNETAKKHARQVALYAEALEKLSGLPVKERYIVLLGAKEAVRL
ncbi:MAG: UvrD-helicase domain-containing protein [Clostridia bacterium]|nr:UvrD-helicase domain-containing protein [Clostridia bacterium]